MILRAGARGDPREWHYQGISDHSPVEVHLALRGMQPASGRPVARGILADPRMAQLLQAAVRLWRMHEWDIEERLEYFPMAVRSAARVVRDAQRWERAGRSSALVIAVARAVALQRPRDAILLFAHRVEARDWMWKAKESASTIRRR